MEFKTIVTHSGSFHADEVTAIALLHVFTPDFYNISRVGHQDKLPEVDFTIDIGRKLDPVKGLFDHHQYELGLSSAGLIWQHLDLAEQYPGISNLINLVDQNDVGIKKALPHEYSRIIGAYNSNDIYNDNIQMRQFYKAMAIATQVLQSMKDAQDQQNETKQIILEELYKDTKHDFLELPKYLIGWDKFLNGEKTPSFRCIMWPKSEDSELWHAQILPVKSGEYEQHGRRFEPDESMEFVHSNGFFCVAKDKETMVKYLCQ